MTGLPLPLVLATGNADKVREINEIFVTTIDEPLAAWALTVGSGTFGYCSSGPPISRDASSGSASSRSRPTSRRPAPPSWRTRRIKAQALCGATHLLAISDDTGLEVDALDGAPGIYAARYSGPDATYADNVAKLLRELEGVYPALRTARFATVALACWPDGREVVVRGEVEGVIAASATGGSGFGYDPVFVPVEGDGRTFAQMSPAEKHADLAPGPGLRRDGARAHGVEDEEERGYVCRSTRRPKRSATSRTQPASTWLPRNACSRRAWGGAC